MEYLQILFFTKQKFQKRCHTLPYVINLNFKLIIVSEHYLDLGYYYSRMLLSVADFTIHFIGHWMKN